MESHVGKIIINRTFRGSNIAINKLLSKHINYI
jgi:hypothetical protein